VKPTKRDYAQVVIAAPCVLRIETDTERHEPGDTLVVPASMALALIEDGIARPL
jgi:hypothetical protein